MATDSTANPNGSSSDSAIRVAARFRPITPHEAAGGARFCVDTLTEDSVVVRSTEGVRHSFTLDRVWGSTTEQSSVYQYVRPVVLAVCGGYNGCIIAYGQTGSGKTHTMLGPTGEWEGGLSSPSAGPSPAGVHASAGVIPRAVHDIFSHLNKAGKEWQFRCSVSFVEVYQEKVRDLLDARPGKDNLGIGEIPGPTPGSTAGVYVKDALVLPVYSEAEVLAAVRQGAANRATGATGMNAQSSRSHALFSLTLEARNSANGEVSKGTLYLVDLAGSETVSKTGVAGLAMEELKRINKSLLALGQVITALTDGKAGQGQGQGHVPYRDSKLTRLLQQGLGGNARTVVLITCSPSAYNESETLSTLRFGRSAKRIKQRAVANVEVSPEEAKRRLAQAEGRLGEVLRREKEWLRAYKEGWFGPTGPGQGSGAPGSTAGPPPWLAAIAAAAEKDIAAGIPAAGKAVSTAVDVTASASSTDGPASSAPATSGPVPLAAKPSVPASVATVGTDEDMGGANNINNSSSSASISSMRGTGTLSSGTLVAEDDAMASPAVLRARLAALRSQVTSLTSSLSTAREELRVAKDELEACEEERDELAEERPTLLRVLAQAKEQLGKLRKDKEAAEEELRTARQEVQDAHAALLGMAGVEAGAGGTPGPVSPARPTGSTPLPTATSPSSSTQPQSSSWSSLRVVELACEEVWENQGYVEGLGWMGEDEDEDDDKGNGQGEDGDAEARARPLDVPLAWSDASGSIPRHMDDIALPVVEGKRAGSSSASTGQRWLWTSEWVLEGSGAPSSQTTRLKRSSTRDSDDSRPPSPQDEDDDDDSTSTDDEAGWMYGESFDGLCSSPWSPVATASGASGPGAGMPGQAALPAGASTTARATDKARRRRWVRTRVLIDTSGAGPAVLALVARLDSLQARVGHLDRRLEARESALDDAEGRFTDLAQALAAVAAAPDPATLQALAFAATTASTATGAGPGRSFSQIVGESSGPSVELGHGARLLASPAGHPGTPTHHCPPSAHHPHGHGAGAGQAGGTGFFRSMLKRLTLSPPPKMGGGNGNGGAGQAGSVLFGSPSSKAGGGAGLEGIAGIRRDESREDGDGPGAGPAANSGPWMQGGGGVPVPGAGTGLTSSPSNPMSSPSGPSQPNPESAKPFFTSCEAGDVAAMKAHLSSGIASLTSVDRSGRPAILYAARGGQLPALQELSRMGCPLTSFDKDARTALMYAARRGHVEVAAWLLTQGASPNQCDVHGLTALHQATLGRSTAMAELLLKAGADLAARDCNGNTPYRLAVKFEADGGPAAKLLTVCLRKAILKLPAEAQLAAGLEPQAAGTGQG